MGIADEAAKKAIEGLLKVLHGIRGKRKVEKYISIAIREMLGPNPDIDEIDSVLDAAEALGIKPIPVELLRALRMRDKITGPKKKPCKKKPSRRKGGGMAKSKARKKRLGKKARGKKKGRKKKK